MVVWVPAPSCGDAVVAYVVSSDVAVGLDEGEQFSCALGIEVQLVVELAGELARVVPLVIGQEFGDYPCRYGAVGFAVDVESAPGSDRWRAGAR